MSLPQLLQRADIWRGGEVSAVSAVASGFEELDTLLPGGGLPLGALTELLIPRAGIGELSLVLRAAAPLTRNRWLAFIAPPYVPYAPALARAGIDLSHVLVIRARNNNDTLWAMEQTLRAGTCGAVFAWPTHADFKWLRRLQLAAETSGALSVLFMPSRHVAMNSPAAVRLALEPVVNTNSSTGRQAPGLAVRVVKRRGSWPAAPVRLKVSGISYALAMSRPSLPVARSLHAR